MAFHPAAPAGYLPLVWVSCGKRRYQDAPEAKSAAAPRADVDGYGNEDGRSHMRLLALLALALVTCGVAFLVGLWAVKNELRHSWRAR